MASGEELYMALAVGLTVLGSIGNALGYVIQKKGHLSHMEKNEILEIQDEDTKSLLSNKVWISGFIICLIGSILTAVAFKFGAQSVLAPLSALVLVFNAIFATKYLNEPVTRTHIYGILLVIFGSTMAVIFGPKSDNTLEIDLKYIESCWRNTIFLIFFSTLSLICIIDYIFVKILEKKNAKAIQLTHSIEYGAKFMMISYIGLAAYFGSVNVLFMKSFMIIIGNFNIHYFKHYLFYITIFGIIIVNVTLEFFRQKAIKYFDASYVVPIFQVLLILGAAFMGAIFFGEFESLSIMELTLFIIAIIITVIGVAVLAFHVGILYKSMLKQISKQMEKISPAASKTFGKEKELSLRSKAILNFKSKRRMGQTHLIFPAFHGPLAAVKHAHDYRDFVSRSVLPKINDNNESVQDDDEYAQIKANIQTETRINLGKTEDEHDILNGILEKNRKQDILQSKSDTPDEYVE